MNGLPDSPTAQSAGSLDSPPPMPPQPTRKDLMTLDWARAPETGLGPEAANSEIRALKAMQVIKMGAMELGTALPMLAAPMQAMIGQLESLVPQVMADAVTGVNAPQGAPSPVPTAPAGPPQQGPPQGAAGGGVPM